MAVELATAYVSLVPETSKIAPGVRKALTGVDRTASKSGMSLGKRLTAGAGRAVKTGMKAVGVAAGVGLGVALTKGMGRLTAIDNAQAKMRGLGYDAETVDKIMGNALSSVKGTAFGLGDAATVAAQAVAAGIKPGKDLEGVLSIVANNASAAGVDLGTMGAIFSKAMTQANGVQNDVIQQLSDRGIPIYQALGKQLGVTAGDVFKLASAGKIGFDDFQAAAKTAAGSVASEMGTTLEGRFKNLMASVGRIGANLLSGIFPQMKDGLSGLTEVFGKLEVGAKHVGEAIGGFIGWLKDNKGVVVTLASVVGILVSGFVLLSATIKAVEFATAAYTAVTKVFTAVTKVGRGVMLAFNLVMAANPILLVVAAVAALVAGLVWFFTQTDIGRKIWAGFIQFLKDTWSNITSFFTTTFENISQWWSGLWNGVKDAVSTIWDGIVAFFKNALKFVLDLFLNWTVYGLIIKHWDQIKNFFSALWKAIVSFVSDAINRVSKVIGKVTGAIKHMWEGTWNGISSFFGNIWDGIVGTVKKFGGFFKDAFSGIKGFVKSAFKGVLGAVKGPINGLIGLINKAIGGLNSLSVTIPGWVPVVGGQTWGLSLPKIPRLADGATVLPRNGGTLAVLAEAGHAESVVDTGLLNRALKDGLAGSQSAPTIKIEKMIVRDDTDIRTIAQELHKLMKRDSRGGSVSFA